MFDTPTFISVEDLFSHELASLSSRDPVLDAIIAHEESEWAIPLHHFSSCVQLDWDRLQDFKHTYLKKTYKRLKESAKFDYSKKCEHCSCIYHSHQSRSRFCSIKCSCAPKKRKHRSCAACGTLFSQHGATTYCSQKCSNKVTGGKNRRLIQFKGREQSITAWAAEIGIKMGTLSFRLNHGWTVEQAITGIRKP